MRKARINGGQFASIQQIIEFVDCCGSLKLNTHYTTPRQTERMRPKARTREKEEERRRKMLFTICIVNCTLIPQTRNWTRAQGTTLKTGFDDVYVEQYPKHKHSNCTQQRAVYMIQTLEQSGRQRSSKSTAFWSLYNLASEFLRGVIVSALTCVAWQPAPSKPYTLQNERESSEHTAQVLVDTVRSVIAGFSYVFAPLAVCCAVDPLTTNLCGLSSQWNED